MDAAASGNFQPPVPDSDQPGPSSVLATTGIEEAELLHPDDFIISDNFTLSGAAPPAQIGPGNKITQIEAADIQSELNNFRTIDALPLLW